MRFHMGRTPDAEQQKQQESTARYEASRNSLYDTYLELAIKAGVPVRPIAKMMTKSAIRAAIDQIQKS